MKNKTFLYAAAFIVAMMVFHLICAATGNDVTTNTWRIVALIVESILVVVLQYTYHLAKNNNEVVKTLSTILIFNSTVFTLYFSNQTFSVMFIILINIFAIIIGTYLFFKKHD